jgi:hypothetical protein
VGAHLVSVKVPFTRDATDHQCAHFQKTRPCASDEVDQNPNLEADPGDEILVKEEERLNRDHLAVFVLDCEIFILESFPYRIFSEFLVATVLALIGKSALPTIAARQVGT